MMNSRPSGARRIKFSCDARLSSACKAFSWRETFIVFIAETPCHESTAWHLAFAQPPLLRLSVHRSQNQFPFRGCVAAQLFPIPRNHVRLMHQVLVNHVENRRLL